MTAFLWIAGSFAVAFGSERRYGRNGLPWFFLSIFLSPVIGLAFLLAAGPKPVKLTKARKQTEPPPVPANDLDAAIRSLRA